MKNWLQVYKFFLIGFRNCHNCQKSSYKFSIGNAFWSGDIGTRWEDMKAQISAGFNFSISGVPYWTMDIGGFCVENRYVAAQREFDRNGE
ncbi:MAG: glycoside hydrolase family 31 protein [Cyclobacteriaceae bacterium]